MARLAGNGGAHLHDLFLSLASAKWCGQCRRQSSAPPGPNRHAGAAGGLDPVRPAAGADDFARGVGGEPVPKRLPIVAGAAMLRFAWAAEGRAAERSLIEINAEIAGSA
jgi:hypothetical protein